MITFAVSLIVGMAFGLYAGKKRGNGSGWCKICEDLFYDSIESAKLAWRKVSWPFRKGDGPEAGAGGEDVEIV